MSRSYTILRNRCHTSAVVIEILSVEDDDNLAFVIMRMDGMETLRRMRQKTDIPVIFLTAADSVGDKVRGLVIGGDDYLAKPFSGEELIARIRAKLRRVGKTPEDQPLTCQGITVDDTSHTVTKGGALIDVSPTEYRLLFFLMTNAGRVLSRWQILDHVWNYSYEGDPTIVESYVSQLRKKIDTSPPSIIRTIRSIGYRFERE